MDLDFDDISVANFIVDIHWNLFELRLVFGEHLNSPAFRFGTINPNATMQWVWFPKTYRNKLSNVVYKHFIDCSNDCEPRMGWKILWSLRIAPRARHFIWLVFKGKLKTADLFML